MVHTSTVSARRQPGLVHQDLIFDMDGHNFLFLFLSIPKHDTTTGAPLWLNHTQDERVVRLEGGRAAATAGTARHWDCRAGLGPHRRQLAPTTAVCTCCDCESGRRVWLLVLSAGLAGEDALRDDFVRSRSAR